jgi:HlyD family secretion protein
VESARAALGQAQADRDRVSEELGFARAELERYRKLAADGIVARERFTEMESQVKTHAEALEAAQMAVRRAEHELEAAKARLARATGVQNGNVSDDGEAPIAIRSSIHGQVLRVIHESASVVPAGEPLLEVGDPSNLEIVADFLSSDAVRIDPGDPVVIRQWGSESPLDGHVRRVEPSGFTKVSALGVEEQRVNVIIDLDDPRDAWSKLGDRFRVEVDVVIHDKDNVLIVPTSSLFRKEGRWHVYVVDDERARLRAVEIGRRNDLEAEVRGGLDEGETVIVYPSEAVSEGTKVELRSE